MSSSLTPSDAVRIASEWAGRLTEAVKNGDAEAFAAEFLQAGWLRGAYSAASSLSLPLTLVGQTSSASPGIYAPSKDLAIQSTSSIGPPALFSPPGNPNVVGVSGVLAFSLSSPPAVGRAFFRLFPDPSDGVWRANTLFTSLEELKGHEEQEAPEVFMDEPWGELQAKKVAEIEADPTVLIVGAGQAGLMCAARFGRMGIRALVIEKTPKVGDVWRNRYPNLSVHTPGYHTYMLYNPWPSTFPKYVPKQKIGDFFEQYAVGQELAVWTSTTIAAPPTYDEETRRWSVQLSRRGEKMSLSPRHILMATGTVGVPKMPSWPGMDTFKGTVYHSDAHKGAAPFKGKNVVVVGACNSGADMCIDFVLKGAANVTMVQRSATCVLSARVADAVLFRRNYPPTYSLADQDFVFNSTPLPLLLKTMAGGATQALKAPDRALHEGLMKAGMKLTWEMEPGKGEVGLLGFLFDRVASGSLMDMGAGQMIIDGKIKIKQGVEITHFESDSVVFAVGSKIPADVVVLATGYTPAIDHYMAIFGPDAPGADLPLGGLDHEGENRRAYRPSGVKGLWFAIGPFQLVRFLSKHLGMQILAEELGLKPAQPPS
ncbi:hypothetical protein HMN09_00571300 [Mycena chlorophos]|uniref:FAD/NAD(P)-binding domain-containing protein n=1 Tax=Mycena chlorophos TaxID=658473 RepID=A0A8H6TC93_MYCCL|nr:hypothetical protein HMN09_00571300 [Mycena chlorophos]